MIRNSHRLITILFISLLLILSSGLSAAVLFYLDDNGALRGANITGIVTPEAALSALAAPPFGYDSAIPTDTCILGIIVTSDTVTVDFSKEIVGTGLDEARLEKIAHQVRWTLEQFELPRNIRILADGKPLYTYLPPKKPVTPGPDLSGVQTPDAVVAMAGGTSLAGKKISLSPGHGRRWSGSGWVYDRPVYCAPLSAEDHHNVELVQYLNTYLVQDGAITKNYRCIDKNYGAYPGTGDPWWYMGSSYWLKHIGYPCSVYANSSGDCNLGVGGSEESDNILSRPLASDYDNTDIHVSMHTNGYQGDCFGSGCPNGTCTYYDASASHAPWAAISQNLAQKVNTGIVNAIRSRYPDSTWRDRGALDANGSYAETRVPDRAAILIELAFHDSCDRDGLYLRDNFFRSTAMWGVYKGICDYFGVVPSWDYYSYEVVSHDIPAAMIVGQTRTVHITLRNRGVLWTETRQFRLGAVGDSDPFTTQTRHYITGEVGPSQTVTFTFNITAPSTPGIYRTDWRMLREMVTWFGPTVQQDIQVVVSTGDTQPPSVPQNLAGTPAGTDKINLSWSTSTDNVAVAGYKIYRGGGYIGSTTSTTYQDTGLQANTTYSYQVAAYDISGNESAKCPAVNVTTDPVLDFILDNDAASFTGAWSTGTMSTDKYGVDYQWCTVAATETHTAIWRPTIQRSGYYDVFVYYPQGSNRTVKAPYTVVYNGGSQTVMVNQQSGGGKWNRIVTSVPMLAGNSNYVKLGNGTGETSSVVMADAVRFLYVAPLDTTPPTIMSVSASPLFVAGGDTINVSVNAIDNIGVTGVRANGVELVNSAGLWSGTITASTVYGSHPILIRAVDAMGNAATNDSVSYTTAQVLGIPNRSLLLDTAVRLSGTKYMFKTWGLVTRIDANNFNLTDGWQTPVRVNCPNHGLNTGDYASAFGIWDPVSVPPTLHASAEHVRRLK